MRDPHEESHQRLIDINKSIATIEQYVDGKTAILFCNTSLLHDAVLLQFVMIGEAIGYVENEILDKYNYPWYKIRSFRNMIAHEYFNIKMPAVWKIVEIDLMDLKIIIQQILKNEF